MMHAIFAARLRAAAAYALLHLATAGCDGGVDPLTGSPFEPAPLEAPAAPAVAPIAAHAKVDDGLEAALARGEARDVLVLMDDRDLRRRAVLGEVLRSETGLGLLASAYDAQKAWVLDRLRLHRARLLRDYRHLPVGFVRLESVEALAALVAHPDVLRVLADQPLRRSGTPNLELVKQPMVAAHGLLGQGVTVAVLDSGVDYKRPDFGCTAPGVPATCKVAAARDVAPDDQALDTDGHGTNVAGIVLGVAPGARIVGLDVFDGEYAWTSALLEAINWTIENRAKYNIAALNLSLGGGAFASTCESTGMAEAIANAREAGIVTVVASGNEGHKEALSFPACAPLAVSVGAVYHANLGTLVTEVCTDPKTAADQVACFSNTAPFLTMLAPGVDIAAGGFTMSGTSQAAPHVAGAVALLRARHPKESATALVQRLTAAGPRLVDPRSGEAKPRLDLAALMKDVMPPPPPLPTGEVRIAGGARVTNSARVTLDLLVTGGQPTEICISNGSTCGAFRPIESTRSWTLPAGDGTKRVAVWWRDATGRTSAVPALAYVRLDTTAPKEGSVRRSGNAPVTLKWSGYSDGGSGVAGYRIVSAIGAPPAARCSTGMDVWSGRGTSATVGKRNDVATVHYRICAVDGAGNWTNGLVVTVPR